MSSNTKTKDKKGFKIPNTYVLITIIIIIAGILTYIVPAGQYDMIKDANSGRNVVDATSYHSIEQTPIGLMDFFLSFPNGLIKSAKTIFMIFIVGGVFKIIIDTGALDAGVNAAIRKFQNKALLIIPILMFIETFFGAAGTLVSTSIALIPVGVVIAKKLKLDPVLGMAMIYLGSYSGFVTSPFSPFTTVIGQQIADIPIFSGMGFRICVWIIIFLVTVTYVYRYAIKVRKDNANSVLDNVVFDENIKNTEITGTFTIRDMVIILLFIGAFATYVYGALKLKWGTNHLGAVLLPVGVIIGFIGKMNADEIALSFIQGCKNMVFGALMVGFAKVISLVLTQGNIIHTLIYGMAIPLKSVGPMLSSAGMFFVNLIFNLFVPSGSGQAMIVMPLMAPLADIVGVTRQVAVCAYQYGDGMSNIIIPTSGVLMGCLGIAGVPYTKWVKFVLPLFLTWVVIGTIALMIASTIGLA